MRKLDELLQDIPLDDLLGNPCENEGEKNRKPARAGKQKNTEPVMLKRRFSAVAAAAVTALVVGGAIVFVTQTNTRVDPKTTVSANEADPIDPDAVSKEHQTSSADTQIISSQKNKHARALYSAMQLYLQNSEEKIRNSFNAEEFFLSFNESTAETGSELHTRLLGSIDIELNGEAFFAFGKNGLSFVEWQSKDSDEVEIYPLNWDYVTDTLGSFPPEYRNIKEEINTTDLISDRAEQYLISCRDSSGHTVQTEISKDEFPELIGWYRSFLNTPQKVLPIYGEQIELAETYTISFAYGNNLIAISNSNLLEANICIAGEYYRLSDVSILEKAEQLFKSKVD